MQSFFLFYNFQISYVCLTDVVSILASFCVWTKSLVCNDAPQGFYYSEMLFLFMLHKDSQFCKH
jgi:hypothetical protein